MQLLSVMIMNLLPGMGGQAGGAEGGGTNQWTMLLVGGAFLAGMYFLMIRPQQKKQKEEQAMRDNLSIGDEITTIGGIMGRVVTIKEDSIIIETGADRTKLRMVRTAVGVNNTNQEKQEAEREALKREQEAARSARAGDASTRKKSKKKDD